MPGVTPKDIVDVVTKLSSDKAKTREEGVNLLNNWFNGDSSAYFCQYLSKNTAKLKANQVPGVDTWPYLVTALMRCVSLEVSTSKRHAPKLIYVKALRNVVKKAEEYTISGKPSPLLSVVKSLYVHIWEILKDVPSFELDYGSILRYLLAKKEFRFNVRKKVYCSLVLLYLEKVRGISCEISSLQNLRDKVFQTLHSLLKNPPGDFPSSLREPAVKGFVEIFSNLRGDWKYLCKLLECLNTYLFLDGPNLGSQSFDIHDSLQHLVFRCWLTTSEQPSKDILINYARLQLNLSKDSDDNRLMEQIMDVVMKDLDQSIPSNVCIPRKVPRNELFESLNNSQHYLVDLAALVLYKACVGSYRTYSSNKRMKKDSAATQMKERLSEGKWLWNAVLCCLARKYGNRISTELFIYWFEGICENFERILNTASMEHAYDGLLWTLGSLQELVPILLPPAREELHNQIHSIWSRLVHALPTFSSVTPIVDAALALLGKMISNDVKNTFIIPQDAWDLQVFKQIPSVSLLFFISSYFSRRGSHGDHRDTLYVRQNLLRSITGLLRWKDSSNMDEHMVSLAPAAVYALCGGFSTSHIDDETPKPFYQISLTESAEDMAVEQERDGIFECSVENIAKLDILSCDVASESCLHQNIRLPRQVKDSLLNEAETCLTNSLEEIEMESMGLVEIYVTCAFLSKYIYFSCRTRIIDRQSLFITKLTRHVFKLLDRAISLFQENIDDVRLNCCPGANSNYNILGSTVAPLRTFLSSPFFDYLRDHDAILNSEILKSLEKLLRTMVNLFKECSSSSKNVQLESLQLDLSSSESSKQNSFTLGSSKSKIVDVELDASEDSKDGSILSSLNMILRWKLEILQLVSSFFNILPAATWESLFDLMGKETEIQVREKILYCLCQHPLGASSAQLSDLVKSIKHAVDNRISAKLPCSDLVTAVCNYLGGLLPSFADGKVGYQPLNETDFEQNLKCLADVVDNIAESNLLGWTDRTKLISCLSNIIALNPQVGQIVIGRLLTFLHDPDYRVRLFLARKIGILFRTWDGHFELFHDVCANFGAKLVICSRENVVTAKEVLASGPQPRTTVETNVVTLVHIALYSEKVELEAVFMACAAAAIDPGLRGLIMVALDNLSMQLQYTSRAKYFEEFMGQILFCWVTCGMNLAALVGIRDLFVPRVEPKYFIQYCCPWLLPALVINTDTSSLKWIASVASEPLSILVRDHFVPIFSVCMAMHCSKKPGWEKGAEALQSSILNIADMEDHPTTAGVIDRINIFRPDRVFMFLVEMHYKVTAAMHNRHKCHRLAGIEVLVRIIGHRAAVPSTYNYLLKLVGLYIRSSDLQGQCCQIISTTLQTSYDLQSQRTPAVLGEQLQFLVSMLVDCCLPNEPSLEISTQHSSPIVSLLRQLTVDSDSSLQEYVRELEPFPELSIFDEIRKFHKKLCQESTPRDQFLKFVKMASYLPPRLLLWRLQELHNNLLTGEFLQYRINSDYGDAISYGLCDSEVVRAVWGLIPLCASRNAVAVTSLVADFISRVGIGDPHRVVFHLPGESGFLLVRRPINYISAVRSNNDSSTTIGEQLLVAIIRLLKKYLYDDSAKVIDMASQALRGILSTEKGQRALLSFDTYERSIVEVHTKGIDNELVESLLLELERKFSAEGVSLDKSALWTTDDKTFEAWICPLVYSLTGFCGETILRFCQDLILQKAELAELLLPNVFINLAMQDDVNIDIQKLITSQLQGTIFVESNRLTKSIQVMLDALNELRVLHVTQKTASFSSIRDTAKYSKSSSHGSKSRSAPSKVKEFVSPSNDMLPSTFLWPKVYWLSLDYLVVAKSAIRCGSYFTSVMYVEYWCEEHSKSLTLGSPDFSPDETLPPHVEMLVSAVTQINEPDSLYGIIQSHKLTSQLITFEHEGNWNKALECYDLQVRFNISGLNDSTSTLLEHAQPRTNLHLSYTDNEIGQRKAYKGLVRSLQQIGCTHVLDLYCQGLTSRNSQFYQDLEFVELQYEAAWRAGNWDFSFLAVGGSPAQHSRVNNFNESLHSCLRAFQEGNFKEFHSKLESSKQELVFSVHHASPESTEYVYSTIVKLQIFDHLGTAWKLRWASSAKDNTKYISTKQREFYEPVIPAMNEVCS
uniref:Uncharacterized protein n=1 Tax=Kalanchoe fedtschenkoi TaxID=63787 RepID=A0A7N0V2B4_KALFE